MAIPRVGHEVIVTFLEGDPDRPLTGRVFNSASPVPYPLPTNKTRTVFKSMTTPGIEGEPRGFNALRVEDKKGQEEIYVHAEKDVNVYVKNDWKEHVLHDQHCTIDNFFYSLVKGEDQQFGQEKGLPLTFLPPRPQEKTQIGQKVISADLFAPLTGLFRGLCYDGPAKCRQIVRLSCGYLIPVHDNFLIYPRSARVDQVILDAGRGCAGEAFHDPRRDRNPSAVADMGDYFPGSVHFAGELQDLGVTSELVGGEPAGNDQQVEVLGLLVRDGGSGCEGITVFACVDDSRLRPGDDHFGAFFDQAVVGVDKLHVFKDVIHKHQDFLAF